MKIAVRGGHVPKITGCSKFIDELTEDRKVKDSLIIYLSQLGCDVLDVTPPDNTKTLHNDLSYGVDGELIYLYLFTLIKHMIFIMVIWVVRFVYTPHLILDKEL